MDWPNIIGAVVGALFSAAAYRWMTRSGERAPKLVGDTAEIGPSAGYRALLTLVGVGFFALVGFFAIEIATDSASDKMKLIAWIGCPFYILFGIITLRETRARYWLDAVGIRGRPAFGARQEIRWAEVERVEYSESNASIVLHGPRGAAISLSRLHRGHNFVFDALAARVPRQKWEEALRDYTDKQAEHSEA